MFEPAQSRKQFKQINNNTPILSSKNVNNLPSFWQTKLMPSDNQPLSKEQNSTKQIFSKPLHDIPSKDIQKICKIIRCNQKTSQNYEELNDLINRCNLSFFQSLRNYLPKSEYHQFIGKCSITFYEQNIAFSRKGTQDQYYFILIDGIVSFNEEKIMINTITRQEQVQYTQVFLAQKGDLLNPETLTIPKHNTYSLITHTAVIGITVNATEVYSKQLKKFFIKDQDVKSQALSNTSLFKGITPLDLKKMMPSFFNKNFYKFNQMIYKEGENADLVYWILDGEVELIKQVFTEQHSIVGRPSNRKKVCKIVKLSKYEIFGIDSNIFQPGCTYLFAARVSSEFLKTVCISYKSLSQIQNFNPCLNENIEFYLNRSNAMHNKIFEKNNKILEVKENIRIVDKNKKNKKKKKKNLQSLEWWGLAQNTLGSHKLKLQLPSFSAYQTAKQEKNQPMFDGSNYLTSKIEQFRRKMFEQEIESMIQAEQKRKLIEDRTSPYKVDYIPKFNKLKIKMIINKPQMMDRTEKIKKKLLGFAKNINSFCDKLNLD